MEPYRTLYQDDGEQLPETERVAENVIVLPTGQSITPSLIKRICKFIKG
jgi:dTDP-4-amino-4,6-dideoxygalactose transaminase